MDERVRINFDDPNPEESLKIWIKDEGMVEVLYPLTKAINEFLKNSVLSRYRDIVLSCETIFSAADKWIKAQRPEGGSETKMEDRKREIDGLGRKALMKRPQHGDACHKMITD